MSGLPKSSSGRDFGRSRSESKSGSSDVPIHRAPRETKSTHPLAGISMEYRDVPVLRKNERTRQAENLDDFLQKMYEAMLTTVGRVATVLLTGEWPEHEPIPAIAVEETRSKSKSSEADSNEAKFQLWLRQTEATALKEERNVLGPKAFGILIKFIPEYFMVEIESTPNYKAEVYLKSDFCKLVKRLKKVAGASPTDERALKYTKRHEFFRQCRQGAHESLESYYKRVRDIVARCKEVNVSVGTDEEIAMDFLGGADEERYRQNMVDLQNAVNLKQDKWPADLDAAYDRLKKYVVPVVSGGKTVVSGSVFTTHEVPSEKIGGQKIDPPREKKVFEPKANFKNKNSSNNNNNNNSNAKPAAKSQKRKSQRKGNSLRVPCATRMDIVCWTALSSRSVKRSGTRRKPGKRTLRAKILIQITTLQTLHMPLHLGNTRHSPPGSLQCCFRTQHLSVSETTTMQGWCTSHTPMTSPGTRCFWTTSLQWIYFSTQICSLTFDPRASLSPLAGSGPGLF